MPLACPHMCVTVVGSVRRLSHFVLWALCPAGTAGAVVGSDVAPATLACDAFVCVPALIRGAAGCQQQLIQPLRTNSTQARVC